MGNGADRVGRRNWTAVGGQVKGGSNCKAYKDGNRGGRSEKLRVIKGGREG